MADSFFNVSVIDGALTLCRHVEQYPSISFPDAIRQLLAGPAFLAGYDYDRAVVLGELAGWDSFCIVGDRKAQLQETLKQLAKRLKPFWASVSHLGRNRVLQIVSLDQRQCLEVAGLLVTPPPDSVVAWWDELGRFFRAEDERRKMEIGREGERRTMDHETRRLEHEGISRSPIWIALEDNRVGFDVWSFQKRCGMEVEDLRIEVKAASYSPVHFILSRHEWDTARKNSDIHLFHIWNLETGELVQLDVVEMMVHIPRDVGSGEWREVRVTME